MLSLNNDWLERTCKEIGLSKNDISDIIIDLGIAEIVKLHARLNATNTMSIANKKIKKRNKGNKSKKK